MPFTPFHMGPGIFIKAFLHGGFSLMVFGWAQIIMDIQPLIFLTTGEGSLHGFSHTYLGASLFAVIAALSGKYLSELGFIVLGVVRIGKPLRIAWWVAVASAFIGTFSHVILDSIMHGDVVPFYPFSTANGLLRIISIRQLHRLCLYSGLVGSGIYCVTQFLIAKKHGNATDLEGR